MLKIILPLQNFLRHILQNQSHTPIEHLISKTSKALEKKFKIKNIKIKINKTAVAKKYGAESVSVSN